MALLETALTARMQRPNNQAFILLLLNTLYIPLIWAIYSLDIQSDLNM